MVRLIHCVRKRDDITIQEFRRYWQGQEFEQAVERMARLLGAQGYAINATLAVDMNTHIMLMRNTQIPYDGVVEMTWDNAAHLIGIEKDAKFLELQAESTAYTEKFMALEKSAIFFVEGKQKPC